MKNIEVKVLSSRSTFEEIESMACLAARITQRGHKIKKMEDLDNLFEGFLDGSREQMLERLVDLPHPTLQKLGTITVAIVGASRRFLAQITRHQNEVKFMSASLQYSDYSGESNFVIPYDLLGYEEEIEEYLEGCRASANLYEDLICDKFGNDDAGYVMPQSLRGVLLISATPYQFKHIIRQRVCRRNTSETRYVMLKVWDELLKKSPILFKDCVPTCFFGDCIEKNMTCGAYLEYDNPKDILKKDFKKVYND